LAALGVALALLAAIVSEGARAYSVDRAEAAMVSSYLAVGQQIDADIPHGGRVLGPERWWWALHGHSYLSLRNTWFQWAASAGSGADFPTLVNQWQPDTVIVNNNIRSDVMAFPGPLQDQFWSFIQQCTSMVGEVDDPTYFDTQIYRVTGC
jgi:hypothetical protein